MWSKFLGLFSSAFGFVTGKTRLFVEYLLIGSVIVLGTMVITLKFDNAQFRTDMANATKEMIILRMLNDEQNNKLVMLEEFRARDSKSLSGLMNDFKVYANTSQILARKIANLEKTNEKVNSYLNEPVPYDLGCLLSDSCEGNRDRGPISPTGASFAIDSSLSKPRYNSNRNERRSGL
jgi:hypothetical protein